MKKEKQTVIRVSVADSDVAMWEAVCEKINQTGEFAINIEAQNGEELIRRLKQKKEAALPHICVIEAAMHGGMDGFETLKELKEQWPKMYVLVFTEIENEHTVNEMINYGADGYVLKTSHITELITVLRTIYSGVHYESQIEIKSFAHAGRKFGNRLPELNEQEKEFLSLLAKGYSYKEIAAIMHKSPRTLENYHNSLKVKLGLNTREKQARYARDIGYGQQV